MIVDPSSPSSGEFARTRLGPASELDFDELTPVSQPELTDAERRIADWWDESPGEAGPPATATSVELGDHWVGEEALSDPHPGGDSFSSAETKRWLEERDYTEDSGFDLELSAPESDECPPTLESWTRQIPPRLPDA